jgi:hypothetical protein
MKNLLRIVVTTILAVNLLGNMAFAEGGYAGPIAYATVAENGKVYSGTPNVSVSWHELGVYEVTIEGENYNFRSYSTVVTANGAAPIIATANSNNGKLVIFLTDMKGAKVQRSFQFVVYKP